MAMRKRTTRLSRTPNTYWVHKADLLKTIAVEDVEEALEARQEAVMAGLRPAKKSRK